MYPTIQSRIEKVIVLLSISQISQANNYCFRSKGYEPTQRRDCIPFGFRCNYDSRKCCSGSRCKAHVSASYTVYGCV